MSTSITKKIKNKKIRNRYFYKRCFSASALYGSNFEEVFLLSQNNFLLKFQKYLDKNKPAEKFNWVIMLRPNKYFSF